MTTRKHLVSWCLLYILLFSVPVSRYHEVCRVTWQTNSCVWIKYSPIRPVVRDKVFTTAVTVVLNINANGDGEEINWHQDLALLTWLFRFLCRLVETRNPSHLLSAPPPPPFPPNTATHTHSHKPINTFSLISQHPLPWFSSSSLQTISTQACVV